MTKEEFSSKIAEFTALYVECFTSDNATYRESLAEKALDATFIIVDTIGDGAQHIVPRAIRVGINRTGPLTDAEDELLKEGVLNLDDWDNIACNSDSDIEYEDCQSEEFYTKLKNDCRTLVLSDHLYNQLEDVIKVFKIWDADMDDDIEFTLLNLILTFAFAEQIPSDAFINKLEKIFVGNAPKTNTYPQKNWLVIGNDLIFGMSLDVTQLEADIVRWLKKDDTLHPLKKIEQAFANYPKKDIAEALNHLCKMRIIYGGERLLGNSYGLNNADEVRVAKKMIFNFEN